MWKELHLFPVPTAELEIFCHDSAYMLISDETRGLKMVYALPVGWLKYSLSIWRGIVEQIGLPLCCKALACTVSGSLSHGSECLGAERSCCLIIPWCGKRVRVRGSINLCVRKGTKQKEGQGQNEAAGLVVAWYIDFKGSVTREMKEWIRAFGYLWGKCLLSLLWAVTLQRPVCSQSSYIPSAGGKLWLAWALPLLQYL